MKTDHVIIEGEVMKCLRCKETSALKLPLDVKLAVKKMKAFTRLHENCKD